MKQLPPLHDRTLLDALERELRLVPKPHRDEALQVAWVAFLEERNPRRAVNSWWRRELRHRRRQHEPGPDQRRT